MAQIVFERRASSASATFDMKCRRFARPVSGHLCASLYNVECEVLLWVMSEITPRQPSMWPRSEISGLAVIDHQCVSSCSLTRSSASVNGLPAAIRRLSLRR